jgi:anti-anti-sigma factor
MEITVEHEGERAHFTVTGKIDEQGAEELKTRFLELNQASVKEMILDFRGVTHIGSAGIGKLLLFYKTVAMAGGYIRIENVSETIYDLFNVLKLDTIFTISKR